MAKLRKFYRDEAIKILMREDYITIPTFKKETGINFRTAKKVLKQLTEEKVLKEILVLQKGNNHYKVWIGFQHLKSIPLTYHQRSLYPQIFDLGYR